MAKNHIGTKVIRDYEADIKSGVAVRAVTNHAELVIRRFRAKDTFACHTAADQIENWLNALANG